MDPRELYRLEKERHLARGETEHEKLIAEAKEIFDFREAEINKAKDAKNPRRRAEPDKKPAKK